MLLPFAAATGETIWPTDWTPLLLLALGSQVVGQGCLVYALGQVPPLVVGLAC
jgi:drug/metabolite transporter (DMT)-like permease